MGLLSLCFERFIITPRHVPQPFCPSCLRAPHFRLWFAGQPMALPALPSSMPQAAGGTELQTQVPSLFPSAALGPHQGT